MVSLLQFMPWCPIHQIHPAAEISIIPFDRDEKSDVLDEVFLFFCPYLSKPPDRIISKYSKKGIDIVNC